MHQSYFEKLSCQYKNQVVFGNVYILEAHARDEWPVGKRISFCDQPKDQMTRCDLAMEFVKSQDNGGVKMMVDTMENGFEKVFAAWPFRFFGVVGRSSKDGDLDLILGFKAQPELNPEYAYDVKKIESWIQEQL